MKEKELANFHAEQLEKFGMRLRQIRKEKKLSQIDLEVATGIYMAEISKMENGKQNFEFLTLSKLALALGVEIQELFKFD